MEGHRVSETVRPEGERSAPKAVAYREEPIPTGSSTLWTPLGDGADPDPAAYQIFIRQTAVAALRAHVVSVQQVGTLGFMAGGIFRCPRTGASYVIIDAIIPLPPALDPTQPRSAVLQGLIETHEQLRRAGHLLGWYHYRASGDATLPSEDVEAHVAFFDKPWHVALALSGERIFTGGFFLKSTQLNWANRPVPFHELRDGEESLALENYRSDVAERPIDAAPPAEAPPVEHPLPQAALRARLLFPDQLDDEVVDRPQRSLAKRSARYAGYAIVGLLAAVGLVTVYWALPSGASGRGVPEPVSQVAMVRAPGLMDALADTVELAVKAFDVRARMFENRKMTCPDLARGLVQMESRWTAYTLASEGGRSDRDSARAARDQTLATAVDAAERAFTRTSCARP